MKRWTRDFRLIPLVLLATICLFTLKVSGLIFDGGYTLGERLAGGNKTDLTPTTRDSIPEITPIIRAADTPLPQQASGGSWAREMFNYGGADRSDVTGSVGASKPAEKPPEKKESAAIAPPPDPGGTLVPTGPQAMLPAGERVILERLQERREQLDARNRDVEMRESLLKAAELRLEARLAELKAVEGRINATVNARDEEEVKRFKGLVTMYENMKAKEAARIFERLDMKVLIQVSTQINPRKMSEIMAQMSPESAERLTVEMASRASNDKTRSADALPQIEGRPNQR
jgi:flagellar motility protein MotE (MotC chaperone)